jgi:N-carbamoyl-L-amino-acid hydrolase
MNPLQIDAARLLTKLQTLATITDAGTGAGRDAGADVAASPSGTAVTRVVFSPRDIEARAWLSTLAQQAGLSVRTDAVGNTFFRLEGSDPTLPAIATGSHIDAIPHAGMYDGTVGVLGGLEALRALQRAGLQPRRSIELILFTSEEPTRFGIGCLGSRLLSGTLAPDRADTLVDAEGRTLADLRSAAGFEGPLAGVQLAPGAYHAFVELHIEQGPLLERAGKHLGIVTHIAAPASYHFSIDGLGGHAGALLMPDRRDALCAAAELILSVERNALASGAIDTVATIGTCDVYPGAINSVPSRVLLQLDIRDTDPARRESVMQAVRRDLAAIRQTRGVTTNETAVNADEPATCAPLVVEALEAACRETGEPAMHMVSRAYHDTLFMGRIAPVGMLFIPSRAGVSHRPDEYSAPEDIARGVQILGLALAQLSGAAQ